VEREWSTPSLGALLPEEDRPETG